ncbi:hypothetical protein LTR85_007620 [Meristemomyces frigidus]|nr:hypothetical protein LTR85_007620 [Meristemomyces frigidus]
MEGTASARLASTPELVEMILLQLPLVDILLAQRVSRIWHNVIQGSAKLQRALFFKPATDKGLFSIGFANLTLDCTDRKFCDKERKGGLFGRGNLDSISRWVYDGNDRSDHRRPALNPFLVQAYPELCIDKIRSPSYYGSGDDEPNPAAPPLSKTSLDDVSVPHWHLLEARKDEVGITLEDLHDHAMRFAGRIIDIAGVTYMHIFEPRAPYQRVEVTAEEALQRFVVDPA